MFIFGGTDTTIAVAEAVLSLGMDIGGIVTIGERFSISYQDDPVLNARFAKVETWCGANDIPAIAFTGYDDVLSRLGSDRPRIGLVAGWYHMVPGKVRDRFELGCLGFHASLLPALRGGAPLNWAILKGLEETGVTLFQLADGVDDGSVFGQERMPIGPRTMIGELVDEAASASAALVRKHLKSIVDGGVRGTAQHGPSSYCLQRSPEDGRIDWGQPAVEIDRLVRAVSHPYPGAFADLDGGRVSIWRTAPYHGDVEIFGMPAQLFCLPDSERPHVVTGDGVLSILEASDDRGRCAMEWLLSSAQKRFSA